MQRRILGLLAVPAALALSLAGCSGGDAGGGGEATTARGPIDIWYSNNEQEVAWGESMVEAWNADHPDEQINAQEIPAGSSSEEVIGAAITAGTAPCLVLNTAPSAVGQFVRQGGLVDLSTFDDGASYIEERTGEVAAQYQSEEGSYYQLPWKSNPVMIFYNKAIFEAAGLDPESPGLDTYDGFLTASRAIQESGAADYAIYPAPTSEFYQTQFDFMPLYAAATGGQGLITDGQATFAGPEGQAVAEFWKTLYSEGLAGKETYQGDAFADGVAAMSIVGPWAVSVYGEDVDWGAVPVPTEAGIAPEETWTFSDAKNIGMYTACENQATAWDVMKFATSTEQDQALLEATGQMPLRTDLQDTYADYFAENPDYAQFGAQTARVIEVPTGPSTVEILQTIRDTWTAAVISGQGDLGPALQGAADQVDELTGS